MHGRIPSLAVVGSGPAAFYTVLRILQKCPDIRVDMFERQFAPFGLTRFGVAPDHPEVKNCQERFAEVAQSPHFRFHGNCEVGKDVRITDLANNFDAVLLAYGANGERKLNIPGESDTPGVLSARHFVGWYNGEPEFQNLDVVGLLSQTDRATIIGNGNVALDIARILLRDPKELTKTDITSAALDSLQKSRVRKVEIVGRRGLLHSAFTNKELRELQREPGTTMLPVQPLTELDITPSSRADKRKLDLLRKTELQADSANTASLKHWQLRFMRSPKEFIGGKAGLRGINWVLNRYNDNGKSVLPTENTEYRETKLAFTSIGYKSLPIPGINDLGITFDNALGVIPRSRGKVPSSTDNVFASGWATTGPVGVIASTMMDAFSVGDEIVQFMSSLKKNAGGRDALNLENTSSSRTISWKDWEKLDAEEVKRGKAVNKIREKFLSTEGALNWLDKN